VNRERVFTMVWVVCGYLEVKWTPTLFAALVVVSSVGMTTYVQVSSEDVCGRGREKKKALAGPFLVCVIRPM
jgi:hypothetical protein